MEEYNFAFIKVTKEAAHPMVFQSDDYLKRFEEKILIPLRESAGDNPYRLKRPVGVLIYGAPGCGKSFLAQRFALMLQRPYIFINKYDLLRNEKMGLSCEMNRLFNQAEEKSATIILENVETILPSRQTKEVIPTQFDVANILNLIKSCPQKGIFIIAITSRPQDVESQIGYSGYLNELFYTPFPDIETRSKIIKYYLEGRPLDDIDIDHLAKECEGYTIDDIFDVIDTAATNSLLLSKSISTQIILDVIHKKVLFISPSVRQKYEEMHQQLENRVIISKGIGFV